MKVRVVKSENILEQKAHPPSRQHTKLKKKRIPCEAYQDGEWEAVSCACEKKKLGEEWHTHEWSEGTHHHGQGRKSTYTSMQAK